MSTHIKKIKDTSSSEHLIDALHSSIIYISSASVGNKYTGYLEGYVPGDDQKTLKYFLLYNASGSDISITQGTTINVNGTGDQSLYYKDGTESGEISDKLSLICYNPSGSWFLYPLSDIIGLTDSTWQKKITIGTAAPTTDTPGDIYIRYSSN